MKLIGIGVIITASIVVAVFSNAIRAELDALVSDYPLSEDLAPQNGERSALAQPVQPAPSRSD